MSENRHGTFNFEIIGLILIMLVVVIVIVLSIISKNNQYNEMLVNIENKQWEQAKEKLDVMGSWKDAEKYVSEINYNYYLTVADEQLNNQNLENALDLYKKAKEYNNNDKNLDDKIKVVQNKIDQINKEKERLAEIERKKAEQERIKAEQERIRLEKLKPSVNKLQVIYKKFGYTKYGECGVVGQIKNNNPKEVFVRADIDLLDYEGDVVGDTYTYDKIPAYGTWNFEAPIFSDTVGAEQIRINLSIE